MRMVIAIIIATKMRLPQTDAKVAFNEHLINQDSDRSAVVISKVSGKEGRQGKEGKKASLRGKIGAAREALQDSTSLATGSASAAASSIDIVVPPSAIATDMDFYFYYYGSDKGDPSNKATHTYTRYYYPLFLPIRSEPIKIFELGLGMRVFELSLRTHNCDGLKDMGHEASVGHGFSVGSLLAWRHFFNHKDTRVFGGYVDGGVTQGEGDIETFQVDQTDASSVRNMWSQPSLRTTLFDIIIDDGLHTTEANVLFFEKSVHKLRPGGVYIIEDVEGGLLPEWFKQVSAWEKKYPRIRFEIKNNLPINGNYNDNNLIVAQLKP